MVIVLAAALAIFLILAIVIAALTIRFLKTMQAIAEKAQELVNSAESAAAAVSGAVGRMAALKVFHNIIEMVTKHSSGKKEE